MSAPAFSSSHYRARGMQPAYWGGLVLGLTPLQVQKTRAIWDAERITAATEEQIAAQDEWYEQARAEQERETAEFRRLFAPFVTRGDG